MNDNTIELTPNYEAIFRHMIGEAERLGKAGLMFETLRDHKEAEALRSVQRWFAPLTIAANSATSRADIERLRAVMTGILADINTMAQDIENMLEGVGEEAQ